MFRLYIHSAIGGGKFCVEMNNDETAHTPINENYVSFPKLSLSI